MGLYFDADFTQLLKIGDMDGAIALLIKKYPHLKNDKDQQARYIKLYSARVSYINATNVRQSDRKQGTGNRELGTGNWEQGIGNKSVRRICKTTV